MSIAESFTICALFWIAASVSKSEGQELIARLTALRWAANGVWKALVVNLQ